MRASQRCILATDNRKVAVHGRRKEAHLPWIVHSQQSEIDMKARPASTGADVTGLPHTRREIVVGDKANLRVPVSGVPLC